MVGDEPDLGWMTQLTWRGCDVGVASRSHKCRTLSIATAFSISGQCPTTAVCANCEADAEAAAGEPHGDVLDAALLTPTSGAPRRHGRCSRAGCCSAPPPAPTSSARAVVPLALIHHTGTDLPHGEKLVLDSFRSIFQILISVRH